MTDLRAQLQSSLGDSYAIERELGGGGMSRVFIARELSLDRLVVVKVLPPEMLEGVSMERFNREIQLAAGLQHSHIVPVLAAGRIGGAPYYTMPFVDGETLGARVERGPLPLHDVVSILRDIARALAYAHERGIVHRDIKPANVLLSGGSACVTDFGIAKALSTSRVEPPGGTLTQVGTSIGTPAYMAPEQASADSSMDHRADIYSFGCVAYELLSGHPPFVAASAQKLLAAHMTTPPRPIAELRPDAPRALCDLVMACLEKDADDRPQSAAVVIASLDRGASPSGSVTSWATMTTGGALAKALALYAVAFIAVAMLARLCIGTIGLPDWVFPGALVAMIVTLPVVVFTGSWQRTMRWGSYTLGTFTLFVAAAMLMRVSGIGPFATLLSAGTLARNETILVAEFALANSSDTTLGRVIADAVKTDLGESNAFRTLPDRDVAATLARMERSNARLLLPVAQDVAQRRGVKAIVDGTINPVGNGFVVKLRVVSTDSSRELASVTGAADSPSQLIEVVGRLTHKLRVKMGESLKSVQASPELQQVTTASLPALRRYSDARYALDHFSDRPAYVRAVRDAIALDSNFATAYLSLGIQTRNWGGRDAEASRLISRAYQLRDRLPEDERLFAEVHYLREGPLAARDQERAHAKLDTLLMKRRDGPRGANYIVTAAVDEQVRDHFGRADSLLREAVMRDTMQPISLANLIRLQMLMGRRASADTFARLAERRFPGQIVGVALPARLVADSGKVLQAEAWIRTAFQAAATNPYDRATLAIEGANYAGYRGALREQARWLQLRAAANNELSVRGAGLQLAAALAATKMLALGDSAGAVHLLDSALARTPVESMEVFDRPYPQLAEAYAMAAQLPRARVMLAGTRQQQVESDPRFGRFISEPRAEIAMAERKWDEAISILRSTHTGWLGGQLERLRGMAFDGAGQRDSAIVWYERSLARLGDFSVATAVTQRRLGELYEAAADRGNALMHYQKFVEAWKGADAELQPQVADVRGRIARLQQQERRGR